MRGPFLFVIGSVVVILICSAIVGGYFGERGGLVGSGGGPALLAGAPAASYPVKRVDGSIGSLQGYRGQVVFVNLWATWCVACREEMPDLDLLYRREHRRGLVVLGIDQGESTSAVARFMREVAVHYPIFIDEEQRYGRAYAAVGLPTSLIVDRGGHIVRGIDGQLTFSQMRDAVEPALR